MAVAKRASLRVGGFTDWAKKTEVKIFRGNEKPIIINVEDILDKGMIDKDVPLLPNDLITVPKRFFKT